MKTRVFHRFISLSAALLLFIWGTGHAADGPIQKGDPFQAVAEKKAPSVEELTSEALSNSPLVHAARLRLAASRELIEPASTLPDPELEFSFVENIRSISSLGYVKSELMLKQGLPFPGKRSMRGKTAGAEADSEYAALIDIERQIVREIRTLYAGLYALDSEISALGIARELLKMLEATAAARYSAGEGDQEAQIKAQLETSRILERVDDIAAERKGMVAQLNRLLGRSKNDPIGKVVSLVAAGLPGGFPEKAGHLALLNTPALYLKKATVKAAEYRLESARLDFWPDFFGGIGISLDRENNPETILSLGMTLPVWRKNKQKPLERAAAHKLEEAKRNLEELEISIRSEIVGLIAKWDRDQEQIRRYRDAIIPQTSAALDSARASYLSGRADFSVVIEDYNLWLEARTQLARRESERFITRAGLDALIAPYPSNEKKGNTT